MHTYRNTESYFYRDLKPHLIIVQWEHCTVDATAQDSSDKLLKVASKKKAAEGKRTMNIENKKQFRLKDLNIN